MTTLGYDASLPLYGAKVLHVPCDLDIDVGEEFGEPYIKVTGIKVEGVTLPAKVREPGTLEQHLAHQILNAAYADDELAARAFAAFGWTSRNGTWHPPVDEDAAREFREAAE